MAHHLSQDIQQFNNNSWRTLTWACVSRDEIILKIRQILNSADIEAADLSVQRAAGLRLVACLFLSSDGPLTCKPDTKEASFFKGSRSLKWRVSGNKSFSCRKSGAQRAYGSIQVTAMLI